MWSCVRPASLDLDEISLVDAAGRERRHDSSAVLPATPTILRRRCGAILLKRGSRADGVAEWLLRRARALRGSPGDVDPRW